MTFQEAVTQSPTKTAQCQIRQIVIVAEQRNHFLGYPVDDFYRYSITRQGNRKRDTKMIAWGGAVSFQELCSRFPEYALDRRVWEPVTD